MLILSGYWDVVETHMSSCYLVGFSLGVRDYSRVSAVYIMLWRHEDVSLLCSELGRYYEFSRAQISIYRMTEFEGTACGGIPYDWSSYVDNAHDCVRMFSICEIISSAS